MNLKIFDGVNDIATTEKLREFCSSDGGLDILSAIQYRGVPGKIQIDSKNDLLRYVKGFFCAVILNLRF